MSAISVHHARLTPSTRARWRDWNLVALFGVNTYSAALAWQAQAVSYPLYRSVGAEDFVAYHAAYNDAIPLVVIVPGFLTFLGAIAYVSTKPSDVPKREAWLVAGTGVVSLLSTVLWAIPRHDDLDRVGRDAATIDSLLQANTLRVAALTVGAVVLGRRVGALLETAGDVLRHHPRTPGSGRRGPQHRLAVLAGVANDAANDHDAGLLARSPPRLVVRDAWLHVTFEAVECSRAGVDLRPTCRLNLPTEPGD